MTRTVSFLTVNRDLPKLTAGHDYSLNEVLPDHEHCPFLRRMLGEEKLPLTNIRVVFHEWPGNNKGEWQASGKEIHVPLSEFKTRSNEDLATIFVHELAHVLLQDPIRPYENYFESAEELQGIAWSILYLQYLGKEDIGNWLQRAYPQMPNPVTRELLHHPRAFDRDIWDEDFGDCDICHHDIDSSSES